MGTNDSEFSEVLPASYLAVFIVFSVAMSFECV